MITSTNKTMSIVLRPSSSGSVVLFELKKLSIHNNNIYNQYFIIISSYNCAD